MTLEHDLRLKKVARYERVAIVFIALGFVAFLLAVALFLFKTRSPLRLGLPINPDMFAAFGNLISGSVGVFWSLAGIIFFYGALTLQREDLQSQREQFKKSIQIAEQSQSIAEEQGFILQLQKFESTFFALLNQHNQIVSSLVVKVPAFRGEVRVYAGRECFKFLYEKIADGLNRELEIDEALLVYETEYEKEKFWIGHYFRNLYNVIKYVDRSSLKNDERRVYTNVVRAQLSSYELLLLFYNCLSQYGKEKFGPLVVNYHLLKTVGDNKLINKRHMEWYPPSAYGNSFNERQS
jgi:hypothetical protein